MHRTEKAPGLWELAPEASEGFTVGAFSKVPTNVERGRFLGNREEGICNRFGGKPPIPGTGGASCERELAKIYDF